ncbi:uncharacterized protein FOMMEDRAFT_153486 [Fomitiporia mediterranea MF3/22]|uniref:uncharacterized protein n=1 Tax=Fomitiporia mediterranea (strain MF3/22) TaxID=694068 RepID=UPI0004408B12|nr:uncharacterized protein FOMMEDRAFT_153486 [Fomitiporia mediterranea MF3/22]EJD06114.1 hypothetical protein FOMMEDRAFT_153486 [Fomitiporia mediterranea MF3/22]
MSSVIEEKQLSTTDRSGSEPPRSTRDNHHARKPPSKASVKTRASSRVSSLSASILCRTLKTWEEWATLHKIRFIEEDWKNDEFNNFMKSLKYPSCILEEDVIRMVDAWLHHLPNGEQVQREFSSWRDRLNSDKIELGDKYQFAMSLPILLYAWKTALIHAEPKINEASNRRGADILIELAFQSRPGGRLYMEVDMILPGHPDTVKADAVASLTLPREWTKLMGRLRNQHVFSWAWCEKLTKLPASIVTLGFEAKVDDPKVVSRQVQLTMFSSQLHRRALGLTDGPVFGTVLSDNKLHFYVSVWENDTVVVRWVNDIFELTEFGRFIECYFFLCGISEFQSSWLKNEMKRWDEDRDKQETKLRESATNPWRKGGKENNKGGRHANNSNQDRGDENDLGEVEPDEADQDDEEVDVGTSRKHDIELLEDRINRGDSLPKDGYPLTEVSRYIFDHNLKFQSRRHVPSVLEWARDSSQFVGYYEERIRTC